MLLLSVALLIAQQENSHLRQIEVGVPIVGAVSSESLVVHTDILDKSYTDHPTKAQAFSFLVSDSGPYYIELRSYYFDAYLVIQDSDGLVGEDDDGLMNAHSRLEVELQDGREYQILACALHGKVGEFSIQVHRGKPDPWTTQSKLAAEAGDFERVLEVLSEANGEVSQEVFDALNTRGIGFYNQRRYNEALSLIKRAHSISEKLLGEEHQVTLQAAGNVATILESLGRYEEAREQYEIVIAAAERTIGPEHAQTVRSLSNLAYLLEQIGEFEQALAIHEKVLKVRQQTLGADAVLTGLTLVNLGSVHRSLGAFDEARIYFERAIKVFRAVLGPVHMNVAIALNNLSIVHSAQGRLADAMELSKESLEIRTAVLDPEDPGLATAMDNHAQLLHRLGKLDEAMLLTKQALAIRRNAFGDIHPRIALSLNNYGIMLMAAEKPSEGLEQFQLAYSMRQKMFGLEHPNTVNCLHNIANALEKLGQFEEAEKSFILSLEIHKKVHGQRHIEVAQACNNLANLYQRQGKYELSTPLYTEALEIGSAYLDGQFPTLNNAERFQLLARIASPTYLFESLARTAEPNLAPVFQAYQSWKGKATRMQAATLHVLNQEISGDALARKKEIQELDRQLSSRILVPTSRQLANHFEQMRELRKRRLVMETELNRALGVAEIFAFPGLKEIQSCIPDRAALVDFFVGRNVFAWVLRKDSELTFYHLGTQAELRDLVKGFLEPVALREGGRAFDSSASSANAQLLEFVWEPLCQALGDADHILISPDGTLCELPFGILQKSDGEYLLEGLKFSYLSDSSSLIKFKNGGQGGEGEILAVGDINFFKRGSAVAKGATAELGNNKLEDLRGRLGDTWSQLPHTGNELQAIRDLHKFVLEWDSELTLLSKENATEEQVRSEVVGKKYLHFATHGYFEPDHLPSLMASAEEASDEFGEQVKAAGLLPGLLSGLVFAGANVAPTSGRDDGYLTAEDIGYLDLSACELAVLSACQTSLGSERAGEGLMSVRRSFEVAGADTVISSLWSVFDDSTAVLMRHFYENMLQKGMSKSDALHQAKLRMLNQNRADFKGDAQPSTWGPFVLSGNWN
ncbi:MAG: CHAT domain-containing protein [Planctomycetes bacterium]|nr:CHAT domain-containing protein [Planctomycetota bacterium]